MPASPARRDEGGYSGCDSGRRESDFGACAATAAAADRRRRRGRPHVSEVWIAVELVSAGDLDGHFGRRHERRRGLDLGRRRRRRLVGLGRLFDHAGLDRTQDHVDQVLATSPS